MKSALEEALQLILPWMIIWGSWWAWWISSPSPERCMEVAQNIELLLTQDSGGGGPGERVLQKYHLTFHRSVHSLKKNRSAKIKFAARHTGCLFNGSSPKMTKYWKVNLSSFQYFVFFCTFKIHSISVQLASLLPHWPHKYCPHLLNYKMS